MTIQPETSVDQIKRHAKKWGVDGCLETAVEARFSLATVAELIEWLDDEEFRQRKAKSRYATKKRHKLSFEDRAADALGIPRPSQEETT